MAAPLPAGFTVLRPHQEDAIQEIVEAFESGIDIVYLDAPTGSGKTLIGHQVARELNAKALYVCSDKSLQDQFARDFPHAKVLKGRANYPTEVPGHFADECTATGPKDGCLYCPNIGKAGCAYEVAKREALKADLAVTNTAYFLTEANGPGRLGNRDLVIVDEADTLESVFMGHVEYRAPKALVQRCGMDFPKKGAHKKTLVQWLDAFGAALQTRLSRLDKEDDEYKPTLYAKLAANGVRDALQTDIDSGADDDGGAWVRDYPRDRFSKTGSLVLKPVKVSAHGVNKLWRHGQRWLVMSATIVSADEMNESLGVIEDHAVVTCPMTFPVENREVFLAPVADVTYKGLQEGTGMLDLGYAVLKAAENWPDERIIVHTVSYKLAEDLERVMRNGIGGLKLPRTRKLVRYSEGRNRESALSLFKQTPGAILLAPSMSRGIDLPDDLCRVQIIAKCPFPALGDKQISARLHTEGGQLWYTVKTIRDIVQMTGRAVRHEEDWAVTYIFDQSFTRSLWGRWKMLFPEWWRMSVRTDGDMREYIRPR